MRAFVILHDEMDNTANNLSIRNYGGKICETS
jgi:hypothetical protein